MLRHMLTSKHFRYGAILSAIGAAGLALFGVFRIAAFSYFGPITLPYTTPIDDISGLLFFGGLPVAEFMALVQWARAKKDEVAPMIAPAEAAPVAALATANLVFVDHEAALMLGDAVAHLPPMKNEHCLCRAMFKHRINEPVDWSLPYEEMVGQNIDKAYDPSRNTKAKRMVYDTTKSLNARAKQDLGIDELFKWQGKTIKRTK